MLADDYRVAGAFPPAEPLVLWIGEQVQVHLFGGSPTAVTFQFWLNVLSSVIQGRDSTHLIYLDVLTFSSGFYQVGFWSFFPVFTG